MKFEISSGLADQVKAIQKESELKIQRLIREYVEKNNPFKIGDILQDHYQVGKVRTIKFSMGINVYNNIVVEISYYCDNLTQKMEANKKDPYCMIYLCNVKGKLN